MQKNKRRKNRKKMEVYLYSLMDFCEGPEEKGANENTHLMETKINVVPMMYGFFDIGYNFIDIYAYTDTGNLVKPTTIIEDKMQILESRIYSLIIPYKDMRLAQKTASLVLKSKGYNIAAKSVENNMVTHRKRMSSGITRDDINYAKKWDKKLMEELLTKSER